MVGVNPTRFALTYTVKDEARLLPDALNWHRALGCERFTIFLDRTSDGMREWLPTQPDVVVHDSIRPGELSDPPSWIGEAARDWDGFIDVRKNLNSWVAAREAAAEGVEWLAMIDPDELLLPDAAAAPAPDQMQALLARVPAKRDQLFLKNCDVLAGGGDGTPFGHRHFLARQPVLEAIWRPLRKLYWELRPDTGAAARFDHAFWTRALGKNFPRELIDPETGEVIPTGYFLSYANQKAIFRTARWTEYRPFIHHWAQTSGRRNAYTDGTARVLHYDLPDEQQFLHKFAQRAGHREFRPKFSDVRLRLAEIASELPREVAAKFFAEQVSVSDPARLQALKDAGIVLDLPQVPAFFAGEGDDA